MPRRKADPDPADALAGAPVLMTITQASAVLGLSESAGYRLALSGGFPGATRLGSRRWVVRTQELRHWLAGQEGAGSDQPARPALRVVAGGGRGGGAPG